jgi:hypothetical protein
MMRHETIGNMRQPIVARAIAKVPSELKWRDS